MSTNLLILWITFSGLAAAAVAAILIWAARTKQFSQQDRARYLALSSGAPPREPQDSAAKAAVAGQKYAESDVASGVGISPQTGETEFSAGHAGAASAAPASSRAGKSGNGNA